MFEGLKAQETDPKDDTFRFCFGSNQQRKKKSFVLSLSWFSLNLELGIFRNSR